MKRIKFDISRVTLLVVVVIVATYFVLTGTTGNNTQYLDKKAAQQLQATIKSFQNLITKDDEIGNNQEIIMFKHLAININGVADKRSLEEIFVKHADRVDLICRGVTRLGHKKDGGWNVCQANNYSFKKPCLVYSFGISYDWSFDHQVVKDHECIVRAFDPSIKLPNHTHGDKFPVQFYNLGLGGTDFVNERNWTIRKFSTLYHELEKGKWPIVDFLKLDIESSEYQSIINMEKDGMLKYIKQIAFELHILSFGIKKGVEILHILERNGFRKWSAHVNMGPFYPSRHQRQRQFLSTCYEFSYINTIFLDNSTTKYLSFVAPYGYNAFD